MNQLFKEVKWENFMKKTKISESQKVYAVEIDCFLTIPDQEEEEK